MSLCLRTGDDSWKQRVKRSVKACAFRGTLHPLDAEDRLLITSALWKNYKHRKYYTVRYYTLQGEQLLCSVILDLLQQGICGRCKIYTRLVTVGLDEKLCGLVCSNWDGLFVTLNIQGKVVLQHAASREFAHAPISLRSNLDVCREEPIYWYLRGHGPVTLRDASYFFGWKEKELEAVLQKIHNVQMSDCNGSTVYKLPEEIGAYSRTPTTVSLSDFDPLMLGYEKHENPFLPQRHLRRVLNLQGIVYPRFLYKGNIAGRWKPEEKTLQLQLSEDFDALQRQQIEKAAK